MTLRCILQTSTYQEALGRVYDFRLIQAADMRCNIKLLAGAASKRCTYAALASAQLMHTNSMRSAHLFNSAQPMR